MIADFQQLNCWKNSKWQILCKSYIYVLCGSRISALRPCLFYQRQSNNECASGEVRFIVTIAFHPNVSLQRFYNA